MRFWRGLETEVDTKGEEIRDIHAWMTIEELWQILWKGMNESAKESLITPIYVELADGRIGQISRIAPILQSREPNVGVLFTPGDNWSFEPCGRTLRFGKNGVLDCIVDRSLSPEYTYLDDPYEAAYDYSSYDTTSEMSTVNISGGHLPMRRKVYNLEVANTHTYFVTRFGLWVHNNSGESLPLVPAQNLGVHLGENGAADFSKLLQKQSDGRGIGIVPDGSVSGSGGSTQLLFDGSIAGPVQLDNLYAFALGYVNPIAGGLRYTRLGDAQAYVYQGNYRIASNTLIDVKASDFGYQTNVMKNYILGKHRSSQNSSFPRRRESRKIKESGRRRRLGRNHRQGLHGGRQGCGHRRGLWLPVQRGGAHALAERQNSVEHADEGQPYAIPRILRHAGGRHDGRALYPGRHFREQHPPDAGRQTEKRQCRNRIPRRGQQDGRRGGSLAGRESE
jgi:hypothetical protein